MKLCNELHVHIDQPNSNTYNLGCILPWLNPGFFTTVAPFPILPFFLW